MTQRAILNYTGSSQDSAEVADLRRRGMRVCVATDSLAKTAVFIASMGHTVAVLRCRRHRGALMPPQGTLAEALFGDLSCCTYVDWDKLADFVAGLPHTFRASYGHPVGDWPESLPLMFPTLETTTP